MSERIEREIDELLARLGFDEPTRTETAAVAPVGRPAQRRIFPGSPLRLMLLSLIVLIASLVIPIGGLRPLAFLSAGVLVVAYLTWLLEPDSEPSDDPPGWFARFYRRLYGE